MAELDVQGIIAEAKAKREQAQAEADAARKSAAAQKSTNKAANDAVKKANVSLSYAKNLESTIKNLEGTIRLYTTRLGRGDKLSALEQKEFDKAVSEYQKVNSAYNKALEAGNKILATIPTEAKPAIKPVIQNGTDNTFQLTPKPGGTISGSGEGIQVDDFAGLLKDARKDIKGMAPADRLSLANKLNSVGIPVPTSGEFTDALLSGYTQLIAGAQGYYKANKEFPTVDAYVAEIQRQRQITGAGGTGTGTGSLAGSKLTTSISAPTEAAGSIQQIFESVLGRDATKAEVKSLTKKLQDAEKKNPTKAVTDAKGNVTYTGGIDKGQFLTDLVKALPEYATKKASAGKTIEAELLNTVMDNNYSATPQQLSTWANRIQNGESIKTIQNEIRIGASSGYSEQIKKLMQAGTDLATIISPYRNAMATTLQINPETISLNDPTLNMALSNPEGKEMSLYQYQTALRKDPRWQYTDAARSEASDVATKVLRDFGFMG